MSQPVKGPGSLVTTEELVTSLMPFLHSVINGWALNKILILQSYIISTINHSRTITKHQLQLTRTIALQ